MLRALSNPHKLGLRLTRQVQISRTRRLLASALLAQRRNNRYTVAAISAAAVGSGVVGSYVWSRKGRARNDGEGAGTDDAGTLLVTENPETGHSEDADPKLLSSSHAITLTADGATDTTLAQGGFGGALRRIFRGFLLGLRVAGRVVWMTLVFAPLLWTLPMVLIVEGTYRVGRRITFRPPTDSPWMHLWPLWHWQLAHSLQFAGPLAIKFGQWASTRPDVFSNSFCKALEILHRDVMSSRLRKRALEKIFRAVACQCNAVDAVVSDPTSSSISSSDAVNARCEDIFLEIEAEPIGAGCIAQVHKAVLNTDKYCPGCASVSPHLHRRRKECGAPPSEPFEVAIKLRRPTVRQILEADIALVRSLAWIASWLPPLERIQPMQSANSFAEFVTAQTDLSQEARNLERFLHNFRERLDYVSFPRPLMWTPWMILETFEHGVPVSECMTLDDSRKRPIGIAALQSFLHMVLVDNFVHGDLHPGNVLVQLQPLDEDGDYHKDIGLLDPDTAYIVQNSNRLKPRLIYLDAGLANTLSKTDMRNFIDLFTAVATANGKLAGELMISRRNNNHLTPDEADSFVEGVTEIVEGVSLTSFNLASVEISSVLERMMGLVRRYRVNLDPAFTSLVVSIIVLEGVGRQLDSDSDIFSLALPILWRSDPSVRNQIASAMGAAWVAHQKNCEKEEDDANMAAILRDLQRSESRRPAES